MALGAPPHAGPIEPTNRPSIPTGDARVELPARLSRSGFREEALGQHLGDAHEGAALAPEVRGGRILGAAKRLEESVDEGGGFLETRWRSELELGGGGHLPLAVEVLFRPLHGDGPRADAAGVGPVPWPLAGAANEASSDRVGEEIDELLLEGVVVLERDGAVASGLPKGVPAAEAGVVDLARTEPRSCWKAGSRPWGSVRTR